MDVKVGDILKFKGDAYKGSRITFGINENFSEPISLTCNEVNDKLVEVINMEDAFTVLVNIVGRSAYRWVDLKDRLEPLK